ncbi:hypothetical protein DFH94DRAFT_430271 [Russula ochroleuca]|uniref:Uncharacterized protein n=1 Tax=Russula ochroleuca TaxID=152965 RepID=A0A9P5MWX8_9AGAM|nr:hypothetical protein DFH94DRAFT_430271 [Russula ochroleuca]
MCIRAKLKPPASSPSLLWIHSSIIDCGLPRRNAHSLSCFVFPSVPTVLVYTYAWREGSSETAATYVKTHFFHLSYRRQGGPEPSIFSTALLVWGGRSSIGIVGTRSSPVPLLAPALYLYHDRHALTRRAACRRIIVNLVLAKCVEAMEEEKKDIVFITTRVP